MLCEILGASPHPHCPTNCSDPVQALPSLLIQKIFGYLDPSKSLILSFICKVSIPWMFCFCFAVSLCRSTLVCNAWREFANSPYLWRRLYQLPKWQPPELALSKQRTPIKFPRYIEASFSFFKLFTHAFLAYFIVSIFSVEKTVCSKISFARKLD